MKTKSNKKGFSFGEVLLSVLVLGVSLVGTVSLISKNIQSSIDSRETVIASQLAQEGTELTRNIRDYNWTVRPTKNPTFTGFPAGNDETCRVEVDMTNPPLYPVTLNCNPANYYLALSGNYYVHGAAAGKYQRRISINHVGSTVIVTSMVIWGTVSFPEVLNAASQCTIKNKCTYADLTLTTWGEL
jgi:Tfp pilus assembly protein PilV